MDSTSLVSRRRLAWAVPAVAAVVVGAAVAVPLVASASPSLPPKSAAQLLVDVSKSAGTPLSGTVVETARLGLPALPDTGGSAITPASLLAGSHTAKVWYDGADKARVALVGDLAETDLVRNGRDVWLWTSGKNTAQHVVLPAEGAHRPSPDPAESLTPQQAAARALAAVDPTTKVTVDGTASVAGRSAYELVLAPRDSRSLVGDVRIAVDSETSVPLRVQVNAAGATGRPAFETAFTSVSFSSPSAEVFRFSPPPGAKVSGPDTLRGGADRPGGPDGAASPGVVGSGWTSVLEVPDASLPSGGEIAVLRRAMTPVSGDFGTGQLLRTALVSVLLLDDGRMFVGAVEPQLLEQAAAQ